MLRQNNRLYSDAYKSTKLFKLKLLCLSVIRSCDVNFNDYLANHSDTTVRGLKNETNLNFNNYFISVIINV